MWARRGSLTKSPPGRIPGVLRSRPTAAHLIKGNMKIPDKIDILGVEWDIILSKDLEEDLKDIASKLKQVKNEDNEYLGYFSAKMRKIWIDGTMKQEQQEQTLFHEIIEAINSDLALNLSHDNIDRIEHAIYYVLTKNKFLKE